MPYKRTYRRRPTYRKKSTLTRLTKPKKTTAIMTLAKQIKSIKRSMKREVNVHQYQYGTRQITGGTIGTALTGPCTVFPLHHFNSWSRIFGTGTNDQEANAFIWKSFGIDMHIRSYNEADIINFTVFLVQANDSLAPYINFSTGNLTLTEGENFVQSSAGDTDVAAGLVMLNKKQFRILNIKRFTLGNNGTALGNPSAQTQFGTDRRFYMKHTVNKKVVNPATGDVWSRTCDADPSGNYYILIFNNNSNADAENPRAFINVVNTVHTLE